MTSITFFLNIPVLFCESTTNILVAMNGSAQDLLSNLLSLDLFSSASRRFCCLINKISFMVSNTTRHVKPKIKS